MPTYSLEHTQSTPTASVALWRGGLLAAVAWLAFALFTGLYPDGGRPWPFTGELAIGAGVVALLLTLLALLPGVFTRPVSTLKPAGPWLVVLPLLLGIWVLVTAKIVLLPVPFFARRRR